MKKEFDSPQAELAYRQKRFIPLNIIVTVISLVAALTLMFAPVLTLDMSVLMAEVMKGSENSTENGGGEDGVETQSSSEGMTNEEAIIKMATSYGDYTIKIGAFDFIKASQSDNPLEPLFVSKLVGSGGMLENLLLNSLGAGITIVVLDLGEEDLQNLTDVVDIKAINTAIRKAETNPQASANALTAAIKDAALKMKIDIPDDFDAEFENQFNKMLDSGTENGTDSHFSIERYICTQMSSGEEGNITTYDELANKMFGSMTESLGDNKNILKMAFTGVFGLVLFPAIMWLLLAVLSGTHILRKNKTFLTWYVKIFGFLPCLIFGVAPLAAGKFAPAEAAGMLSAIGSLTWISGACFIALVLLCWVYLYRARRKIKKLRLEVK